ncbi:MAG: dihydroorotase [Melioribacteraceae bacterium]|nr:MAG: dihydroorotase [Melioribacteraceae bacterium]
MEFSLNSPLDMHIHFRQDKMLELVAPLTAKYFAGGVIMPNLVPPVDSIDKLDKYRSEVEQITSPLNFEPYMTLFFRQYKEEELLAAKDKIIGIKLYPAGVTTNSESGISDLKQADSTFRMMQELGIPLLVHGETHGFVMDRESEFISVYQWLAENYPNLRITMEHITTKDAVEFLDRYENVFATVTLQHLLITLNDVAGGLLQPHLFCKPIAKRPEDREALLEAALEAHPKLMFGSDSAPHPVHKKESAGCAAGVFTAPVAIPILVELFEKHNKLENLQTFLSENARRIYKILPPEKTTTLSKQEYTIPVRYGEVVPFRAGETVSWWYKDE